MRTCIASVSSVSLATGDILIGGSNRLGVGIVGIGGWAGHNVAGGSSLNGSIGGSGGGVTSGHVGVESLFVSLDLGHAI